MSLLYRDHEASHSRGTGMPTTELIAPLSPAPSHFFGCCIDHTNIPHSMQCGSTTARFMREAVSVSLPTIIPSVPLFPGVRPHSQTQETLMSNCQRQGHRTEQ